MDELATGVYGFIQPDGSWMINNTGLIVGADRSAVLVDTSSTESRTRAFLAHVAEHSSTRPPVALINTHHHPDHTFGNCLVPALTTVIAHDLCRAEAYAAGLGAMNAITQPEYGALEMRLPDVTFSETMSLHLDTVVVELHHVGPAHTTNDIIVWLPEQRCLFAGDVVFAGGQPVFVDGSLAGYRAAIDRLRRLELEIVIPGHGPVLRGAEIEARLAELDAYAIFVQEIAVDGLGAGDDPLAVAHRHRNNPFAHWQEPERLVANLHRAYQEQRPDAMNTMLRMPDVWSDMVAFNGGPIGCIA